LLSVHVFVLHYLPFSPPIGKIHFSSTTIHVMFSL
jgi:hypothetical protein